MLCGWRMGLGMFLRAWLCILGLFARVVGVATVEVILQGSSDCLAGCIPYPVVQVVRQIDGYRWHMHDNVTQVYKYCCHTIYIFQHHNLYIYVCLAYCKALTARSEVTPTMWRW